MRIMFMGTPDFALPTLRALCQCEKHEVVAVVTQTDKPKGRGYTLTPPPVKVYAIEQSIPVYQPDTLRGEDFETLLSEISPEVIVVVAYGKLLPENVINFPKYGCINVHGSLLPKYRGAAPMQRAIIDGNSVTGVTTMYMARGLDTGDMLLCESIEIEENDNFEDIHDKLSTVGAGLMLKTLDGIEDGSISRTAQDDSLATYASKIEKSDCEIDFSRSAKEIHDRIRGLSPIPLSFTHTPDGKLLKITSSEIYSRDEELEGEIGEVISLDGGKIRVKCGVGAISILGVVPEGKGRMKASDYINGRKIHTGDKLV